MLSETTADQTSGSTSSAEENSQENLNSTQNIESFDDMPDAMSQDAVGSCSNIMKSFESSLADNGELDTLQDATLMKQASLQQNQTKDLHKLSSTLTSKKPGNVIGTKRTKTEVERLLAECLPCLDRPEFLNGLKFAVDLSMTMFRDLAKRFSILTNMMRLRLPNSSYSDICPIIQALSTMCLSDIIKLIALMEFYIKSLFRKIAVSFQFSSDFLSNLILAPFIIAFESLIISLLDTLLKPVECIVGAIGLQATKIPGAKAKFDQWIGHTQDENYTGILFLLKKITNARNELRESFNNAQNDFNAALCSVNLQSDQILELLNDIKESFAILNLLNVLKVVLNGRSRDVCGVTSHEDPLGFYYTTIRQTIETNNNTDDNDNNNVIIDDGIVYVYDDPPIVFDDGDLDIISDVIDVGSDITADDIIEAANDIYGDTDPISPHTMADSYIPIIENGLNDAQNILNAHKNVNNKNNMNNKSDNTLYPDSDKLPIDLDGKMVSAIIELKKCLNRN